MGAMLFMDPMYRYRAQGALLQTQDQKLAA